MKRPEETVLAGFFENPSTEAAREALRMVGSGRRLQILLRICDHFFKVGNAEGACSLFHESWTGCDDTWTSRHKIATLLRKLSSKLDPLEFLEIEDSAAFDALPESILIFRGCSWKHIYGCAWTLDPEVAEGFARGHRGIRVRDPVIASLQIPKKAAFGFYTERRESEILVQPDSLRGRSIEISDLTSGGLTDS